MAEWLELLKEAREIRRREADWDFINRQPPKLKYALIYYVETGDIYVASRIAGMRVEQFDELRRRAKIPTV
ncbi:MULTISPECIES: hypothetical protein [unclassified Pyrobaculum]|uniref:hypothetical protein n=1 Tax=unclassified Pyrobaculum TaxID=2643434 RepID=UPI0021D899F0|nr:hypothetical protein [Pyrobaculum sp. 3827-6]MCU7786375.1 hypothetical protein [Pyrobaculum sp. 3827-6]